MGESIARPRTAGGRTARALLASLMLALVLPASAAAHGGTSGDVEAALGDDAIQLASGLYAVESADGLVYTTHGPDPKVEITQKSPLTPGAPERAPHCIGNPATEYYQHVLYGYPSNGTNDVVAQTPDIQGQIRRNNALLNRDSLGSGGREADFNVRCNADDSIMVTAFPVDPDLSGTSASFGRIVNEAKDAGFGNFPQETNVDYTIFYDGGNPSACGVGHFFGDDSPGVNNLNNNPGIGAAYGVTFKSCWFGRTSIHENAHNEGAAQESAPNSTGDGAHCNERNDILCYVDGGNRNQTLIDCPLGVPGGGGNFYDCGWNTYFDSAPEPGEWLATHWNIGSSVNRFITFGTDTSTPDTTITAGPSGPTNAPAFSFSSSETPATFECSVGPPASVPSFTSCSSPKQLTGLADGPYEFQVRARDNALNTDSTPALRTFSLDTQAPDTDVSGPSGTITTPSPQVSFTASEAGGSFECSLDSPTFTPCTSPQTLSLTQGAHTFRVRALDALGNADPTPAELSLTVDLPPQTTIDSGVSGTTANNSPSFAFSSSDSGSSFECSLAAPGAPSFSACSSPHAYPGLADGTYEFQVRARDPALTLDPSPAVRTFTVDRQAPETKLDAGPSGPLTTTEVEFAFSVAAAEPNPRFECRLDADAFAPCASPLALTVGQGAHTFEVRALDPVGNSDPTPATRTFAVDSLAPETTFTTMPSPVIKAKRAKKAKATFGFAADEAGAAFQCSLDGAAFSACASPLTQAGLGFGPHTFSVRAGDAFLNVDDTPASYSFKLKKKKRKRR